MKKCKWIFAVVLLFCLMMTTIPAAALDNETVVSFDIDGRQLELKSPDNSNACFWEYPTLKAGQHRADGLLRLHNDSKKDATVTLKDFKLPTDKPEEMEYLAALKLTVSILKNNVKEVVYTGPYSEIGSMQVTLDVPKGMDGAVYFEMACDFTYEGEGKISDSITYHIDATANSEGNLLVRVLLVGLCIAAAIAAILTVVILLVKKSKKSA